MKINKKKSIGKVLFIVEGTDDEIFILRKIFIKIFDYQYEKLNRLGTYFKYNSKDNPLSSVFVINTKNSDIKSIKRDEDYLDNLFQELIERYKFPVDNASIFYIFDRDPHSNTDSNYIFDLIGKLKYSRDDNDSGYRQGLMLLSYPSLESFIVSNFDDKSYELQFNKGETLKKYIEENKINQQRINENTLLKAVIQMELALENLDINGYDLDKFSETNMEVFNKQEGRVGREPYGSFPL